MNTSAAAGRDPGYTLFDTAIGRCGIAWNGRHVLAVGLPEASDAATRERLIQKVPGAIPAEPPDHAGAIIADIVALLSGERRSFDAAPLDLSSVPDFNRRVYEVALSIPPGDTLTYGEIAERLGEPGASRAVGRALGENPWPIVVPCHRVLAASGRTGGFSANGGVETKLKMLSIERRHHSGPATLFDADPDFVYQARR